MSLEIATALREKAATVGKVAERIINGDDKRTLEQVVTALVQMAERLERDARD
jgi:hypothetical protein